MSGASTTRRGGSLAANEAANRDNRVNRKARNRVKFRQNLKNLRPFYHGHLDSFVLFYVQVVLRNGVTVDQNTVWVIAIAALIVGALLGFLFGRNGSNGSREVRLAEELDRTQLELAKYRDEVNEHFSVTADLVNGLTTQYQKVHQHLASSASILCRDEKLVESLQRQAGIEHKSDETESQESTSASDTDYSMPLDYAPKREMDEPGTLSDRFGLKSEPNDEIADRPKFAEESKDKRTA